VIWEWGWLSKGHESKGGRNWGRVGRRREKINTTLSEVVELGCNLVIFYFAVNSGLMANVKKAFTGEVRLCCFFCGGNRLNVHELLWFPLQVRDLVDPYVEVCFAGHKVN